MVEAVNVEKKGTSVILSVIKINLKKTHLSLGHSPCLEFRRRLGKVG